MGSKLLTVDSFLSSSVFSSCFVFSFSTFATKSLSSSTLVTGFIESLIKTGFLAETIKICSANEFKLANS